MTAERIRALPGPGDDLPQQGARVVRAVSELVPHVGLVLGSGLGPAIDDTFEQEATFAFTDLPGFPPPGVPGHAGRLALGRIAGVPVAAFFGRVHFYEGHGMDVPALMPRLAQELGADTMMLTAAAGGVVPGLAAGTVAVLTRSPEHDGDGAAARLALPRRDAGVHPDGRRVRRRAARLALERAEALGIAAAPGSMRPCRDRPTRRRRDRVVSRAGATVVGMSVVPEACPPDALGMRVLGLGMVTNAFGEPVSHDEVVRVSNETAKAVGRLLVDLLPRIDEGADHGM